jgi:hypothetical protein
MTRTRSDDRRAIDLVTAYVTGDIATLDRITTEAAAADHLGHLLIGTFEVIEQVLEQLPRPDVAAAVQTITAIATGNQAVSEASAIDPEMVVLAAKLSVAHATNDGQAAAELLDTPQSITLLLDAILGLHLHLLPALGSPEVLRALHSAGLNAALDEAFEGDDGE